MIGRDALANALKDFGAPAEPAFEPVDFLDSMPEPFLAEPPAIEMPDIEAAVSAAVAQAEAELSARLEAEHEARLLEERERHAQELAELGGQIAEEAAQRITAGLQEAEDRLVEITTSVAARILGIALTEDIRDRSIARLAALIREALRDDEAVRIRARGAASLYEALRQAMPASVGQIDFEEAPGFDLTLVIDESIYETRLAEWTTALSEAME